MASLKEIALPHGTIPTQMFGNVNLQNAMMYVNENFASVKDGVNDAVVVTNEAIAAKADTDHNHDAVYSKLEHTHAQSEIVDLSSALDGKAELNHEHTQYLSSLLAHYHATTEVQGLDERLQQKAESVHTHTIAQVENLNTELGVRASTTYVDQQDNTVSQSIKPIADQEIESYAADNDDVAKTPKDASFAPANETDAQKKARIGTSTSYAREDHVHAISASNTATELVEDGHGVDGAAELGTKTTAARTDHSHPLNVATSGTPSDVVNSSGTASLGTATTYAKSDHVHKMAAMTASSWVKTDTSGAITTTDEKPIVASTSANGFVYNTQGTISYKSFGTAAGTVAEGNHTHSEQGTVKKVDNVPPGTDGNVALNALTTSNYGTTLNSVYQAKSDILGAVVSGGHYDATQGAHEITGGAHYLATAPSKPVLLGVAQGSTVVTAREAIGTDMVTIDGGTTLLNSIIDQNGDIDASHVVVSGATGSKAVETDSTGGLVESSSDYAKFTTAPAGGAFVKTNGTDGTLEESDDKVLTDANIGDGLEYDSETEKVSASVKENGGIAIDATTKDLKVDTSASGSSTVNLGYFPDDTEQPAVQSPLWEAGGTIDATILVVFTGVDDGVGGCELRTCKMTLTPFGTIKKIEQVHKGGISIV